MFDDVPVPVTFFLNWSSSTPFKILSSAPSIKSLRCVTKVLSVLSEKSCIAVFKDEYVQLMS